MNSLSREVAAPIASCQAHLWTAKQFCHVTSQGWAVPEERSNLLGRPMSLSNQRAISEQLMSEMDSLVIRLVRSTLFIFHAAAKCTQWTPDSGVKRSPDTCAWEMLAGCKVLAQMCSVHKRLSQDMSNKARARASMGVRWRDQAMQ